MLFSITDTGYVTMQEKTRYRINTHNLFHYYISWGREREREHENKPEVMYLRLTLFEKENQQIKLISRGLRDTIPTTRAQEILI